MPRGRGRGRGSASRGVFDGKGDRLLFIILSWSSSRPKGPSRCRIPARPARPWHPAKGSSRLARPARPWHPEKGSSRLARPARPWHPRGMEAADLSASDFSRAQLWRLGRDARDIVAAATMGNPLLVAVILPHHRPTGKHKSAGARSPSGATRTSPACQCR
jgi:hypothetical protein